MTLRLRLLLATFVLSLTTTLLLGFGVRTAWLDAERTRFEQEFHAATSEIERELQTEMRRGLDLLRPICDHDPLVDSAWIGLLRGDLAERILSLRLRVPELKKALGFDELSLITDQGEFLAGDPEFASSQDTTKEALLLRVTELSQATRIRDESPIAFQFACKKTRGDRWVALIAAQHWETALHRAEARHGLTLSVDAELAAPPDDSSPLLHKTLSIASLGGHTLQATRSRLPLTDAVRQLDTNVILISCVALAVALSIAAWLTRGLARPVVAFAERARRAIAEDPEPLPEEGGPELIAAARAFNQTLADLAQLKDRLALTERIAARREIARQIAHEIKNPLSPIRAVVETLRRLKGRGDPEFEAYFDEATRTVLGEVARINALVRSFSEYASLPSPKPTEFDLPGLIRELAQLHESLGTPITIRAPSELRLLADRDQITQVLTNLIKNAHEALTNKEDPRIEIELRTAERAGVSFAEVFVSDNGPGVPEALRARLFEPNLTTKSQGSGLGLAISQRIAVEHGGGLELVTRAGAGACFRLHLPQKGPSTSI